LTIKVERDTANKRIAHINLSCLLQGLTESLDLKMTMRLFNKSLASFKKKQKSKLPKNLNTSFTFGMKSPPAESILDVITCDPLNRYVEKCKERENRMALVKYDKSIFNKAKPTKSSMVRDRELEKQRAKRHEAFLTKDLGYLEFKKVKNQTMVAKYLSMDNGQKKQMNRVVNLRALRKSPRVDGAKQIDTSEIYKMT
jgi:RecG-like helicase